MDARRRWLTIIGCVVVVSGVLGANTAAAQNYESADSEHLRIMWQDGHASAAEVALAQQKGERFVAAIAELLGHQPSFRIVVVLEGPAERPDGSRGYPRVDSWGRVHLYRFGPTPDTYVNALAHELVHVFRIHRSPHHDWFFEEGFAELIARQVDDSLAGFPWYGFDPTVAAGQWFATGEAIPLQAMRDDHEGLNLPCKAQTYSLRASFFIYLADRFGIEAIVAMAAEDEAGALEAYEQHLGASFDALVADWEAWLLAAYGKLDDAEEQGQRYREESSIQYMPVCREGADY